MSRYKRKTDRRLVFTEENLTEAKQKVAAGTSKRQIAKEMGIPEATLRKRLKCGNVPTSLGRYKPVFPIHKEEELAQQVRDLDARFYGITKKDLQRVAYKFACANNLEHCFNEEKKIAGDTWLKGFCKRHNITLRQPEKCSLGRMMGFNKIQVSRFFENLQSLYEKRQYTPDRIYNMDETGLSTVPNKLPKVLTTKGKKLVGKVSSAERGQLVTAVCCMSAVGVYVPPALIFPRKRMKEELYLNAPPGTLKLISDSGFINTELFYQWIVHFKNFTKPTEDAPVLLILDNHSSHRDLQVIQYCRHNHIDLLSLPPHASHKMQPLDIGFFGPLKSSYSRECDKWMINNPGKVITQMQVASLFNDAYAAVANIGKAQRSFQAAGICPYDPNKFTDDDFAPSLVTDVPMDIHNSANEVEEGIVTSDEVAADLTDKEVQDICHLQTEVATEGNEREIYKEGKTLEEIVYPGQVTPTPCCSKNISILDLDIVCEDGVTIQNVQNTDNQQENEVSISDILPLPCIKERIVKRRSKSQKSEILSSTPFKDSLEAASILKESSKNRNKENIEKGKRNLSNGKNKKRKQQTKEINCPGCGDLYTEPPSEDWIMCSECKSWWHESCTTYVEGVFVCFNC